MGKCFAAGRRGRYEEKGGGQQVGSLFAEATDNEKIKAIYGNFGFWSWLRYWWIDTENYTTFMLMDKGYYDYDYSEPKPKHKPTAEDREIWSAAKLDAILGVKRKRARLTPEQLQAEVMREEKLKREKR